MDEMYEWISDDNKFLPGKGSVSKGDKFMLASAKGESLVKQGLCKKVVAKVSKTEKAED